MRTSPMLFTVTLATALVAAPTLASAQNTLTGQLVELLPGGPIPVGAPSSSNINSINIASIDSNGELNFVVGRSVSSCFPGETTNCISQNGAFNITNLPNGVYLVNVFFGGTHLTKRVNVTMSGNAALGTIPLIRAPFLVEPALGPIPAAGGAVPVSVRVRSRWDLPTLPISARVSVLQMRSDGSPEYVELPNRISFTWPAGLSDTGSVPLAPIQVAPDVPAGATTCVRMVITLAGQPDFILGANLFCRSKQP